MNERMLPDAGRFLFDEWVQICGCHEDSINQTIKKFAIPIIKIPGMRIVDAGLWWSAIYAAHPATASIAKKGERGRRS